MDRVRRLLMMTKSAVLMMMVILTLIIRVLEEESEEGMEGKGGRPDSEHHNFHITLQLLSCRDRSVGIIIQYYLTLKYATYYVN